MKLNAEIEKYWENEPCGTNENIVGNLVEFSQEWFERIEEHRYSVEPFIHSIAQFTHHRGKKILEIGVGAGTDHLQWARAGCECYGVDLTEAAINTTKKHLSLYGFQSNLQQIDAEVLPFSDGFFDLIYSWGVIHHSENPSLIIKEINRVLKPNGVFIGMMYGRHSVAAFKLWLKHAFLKGKLFLKLSDVIWNHMESVGTKAYTVSELHTLFSDFKVCSLTPLITIYDKRKLPTWLSKFFPDSWGWFITIRATK